MIKTRTRVAGTTRWSTCDCVLRLAPCASCTYEFGGAPTIMFALPAETVVIVTEEPIFMELIAGRAA